MAKITQLICSVCEKEFSRSTRYVRARGVKIFFCSTECQWNRGSSFGLVKKQCLNCSNELIVSINSPQKFCNRSCAAQYNSAHNDNRTRVVICANCKTEFSTKSEKKILCSPCKVLDKETKRKISNQKLNGLNCKICSAPLTIKQKVFCSLKCTKEGTDFRSLGIKGGRVSVSIQCRRSKNEIYFASLCESKFENVKCNEPYFNGWDADVILHDKKIAILWNGAWHYVQCNKKHSLEQTQSRDKIKLDQINACGYTSYIIKDMGKYNKKFVQEQFQLFLDLFQF